MSRGKSPDFSPELFAYLRDLKRHNDREWFLANKDRYEQVVRAPALPVRRAPSTRRAGCLR